MNQETFLAVFFEVPVALLVSSSLSIDYYLMLAFLVICLNLWNRYPQTLNLFFGFFMLYYTTLNLVVNLTDFFWNQLYKEIVYRHDDEFTSSFSFKAHQTLLVSILSFVSGQILSPSIAFFQDYTNGLTIIFITSLYLSFQMFLLFIAELTTLSPDIRFKVFKSELVKVFITIVIFYF